MWSDGRREVRPISEERVVSIWVSEREFYRHRDNSCRRGKACGHYKQVVWRDTTEVGCAQRICEDMSQVWVCHYDPIGNLSGQRPY
jgi:hypothetical protein